MAARQLPAQPIYAEHRSRLGEGAIESVAGELGIVTAQTLHSWVRRAQIGAGQRGGVSSDAAAGRELGTRARQRDPEIRIVFFVAKLDRK